MYCIMCEQTVLDKLHSVLVECPGDAQNPPELTIILCDGILTSCPPPANFPDDWGMQEKVEDQKWADGYYNYLVMEGE